MVADDKPLTPAVYNADYFEAGPIKGVSGYMNYRWMPELTFRMIFYMLEELGVQRTDRILDFGCAKGFIVKALRHLDFEAYGVDISEYAIKNADGSVRDFCDLITGCDDANLFPRPYDWMISKDVFEHIPEDDLRLLLHRAQDQVAKMFIVVPLAADDDSGRYVVPDYDRDVTHILAKTMTWWQSLFEDCGWLVQSARYSFPGCKENWTEAWPKGNGFFTLMRPSPQHPSQG